MTKGKDIGNIYPNSRVEDVTDAYMNGFTTGYKLGKYHEDLWHYGQALDEIIKMLESQISNDIQQYNNTEEDVSIIDKFTYYQIKWLTSHCDIELDPELEALIIRFLIDSATCFKTEM